MQQNFSSRNVVTFILIMQAILLAFATVWSVVAKINLRPLLELRDPMFIVAGLILGVATSVASLVISGMASKFKANFGWLAAMDELMTTVMKPLFSKLTPLDILLIAIASGFCEEVFFRGVLQERFGLLTASIAFGLVHFAGRRYLVYMLWAIGAGLLFGVLVDWYHTLWISIAAHFANNLVGVSVLRYSKGDASGADEESNEDSSEDSNVNAKADAEAIASNDPDDESDTKS